MANGELRAAKQGYPDAQHALGHMYLNGWGGAKDASEGAMWVKEAAEQGNVEAQVLLAALFLKGVGVKKDETAAYMWLSLEGSRGEAGEVRAFIRHPPKPMHVMAIVGDLGRSITKRQFESSPNRDARVEAMMEFSVEQVYKKTSRDIGAEQMIVSEKRVRPSDAGIKFYISTAYIKDNVTTLIAGIHIVPFEKPYMVTFTMITPMDRTATKDNETITRVFNSFHVLGERPIK